MIKRILLACVYNMRKSTVLGEGKSPDTVLKLIKLTSRFIERDDCVESFHQVIQDYTDKCDDPDALIGVHCTNGINRCGYLICRFLIDRLGWSSHEAIDAFEQARGYSIEKGAYVMALHKAAKDKRDKQVDSDSDSSERQRKKKNKRKHREIVEHENIVLINTIIGELGSQAASVSGTDYQNSPNGVSVDPGQPQPHHWGFAIKVIEYHIFIFTK